MPKLITAAATRNAANARIEKNKQRLANSKPPSIREFIPPVQSSVTHPTPRNPDLPASPSYLRPGRGRARLAAAPTPWMTITVASTQIPYKCRLRVKRRGGALWLEFHPTDATAPGRAVFLHSARPGYFEFIQAGHGLLRASQWDQTCAPGERAVWNHNAVEYAQRRDNAETVSFFIDRLLNPKVGRPGRDVTRAELDAASRNPSAGLRTGYAVARARRRSEMLTASQKIANILIDVTAKFEDARSMVGYTRAELKKLMALLGEMRVANDGFRDVVFSDKFAPSAPPQRRAVGAAAISEQVHEEMTHDFDDIMEQFKFSPPNEAELRTERCTTGAEAVGQFKLPHEHKVDIFLKPDEMAYYYNEPPEVHNNPMHVFPESAVSRSDEDRQVLWDELNARMGRIVGGARR